MDYKPKKKRGSPEKTESLFRYIKIAKNFFMLPNPTGRRVLHKIIAKKTKKF